LESLYHEKQHLRVLPGRKKLLSKLKENVISARSDLIPILKRAQDNDELRGTCDIGSKKYTMQPAMTVSLHWPERSESGISLQSIVIGTCSFDSAFYLSKKINKN